MKARANRLQEDRARERESEREAHAFQYVTHTPATRTYLRNSNYIYDVI